MGVVSSSEKEIIDRFLAGSDLGFEELVARYEKKIYSLCLGLSQSEAVSEAILTEVFCAALDELPRLARSGASLSSWLYQTAIELAAEREAVSHAELDTARLPNMYQVLAAAVEQ